jgi:methylated-DNA-[protein]-cysteine S-methyltransferase
LKGLTPFQRKIYNLVSFIPYGQTRSYSFIAERIGTSPRAIGRVLSKNPLPIVIPCHRVIKKDGELGGFKCGKDMKEKILEIERENAGIF